MTDDHGAWKEPIERVTEAASVRRVFGEPITAHDRTVIPMATGSFTWPTACRPPAGATPWSS